MHARQKSNIIPKWLHILVSTFEYAMTYVYYTRGAKSIYEIYDFNLFIRGAIVKS